MKALNGQSSGSILTESDWDEFTFELENVIKTTDRMLDSLDTTQLGASVRDYCSRSNWYYDFSLIPNLVLLAKPNSLVQSSIEQDGQIVRFRPGANNTGAVGFSIGLGPTNTLRTEADALLVGGELLTNRDAEARYDAATTHWFLIGF